MEKAGVRQGEVELAGSKGRKWKRKRPLRSETKETATEGSGDREQKTRAHKSCLRRVDVRGIHTKEALVAFTQKINRNIHTKGVTRALAQKRLQRIHTKGALPQRGVRVIANTRDVRNIHKRGARKQECNEAVEKSCYIDDYMNTFTFKVINTTPKPYEIHIITLK